MKETRVEFEVVLATGRKMKVDNKPVVGEAGELYVDQEVEVVSGFSTEYYREDLIIAPGQWVRVVPHVVEAKEPEDV